MPKQYQIWTADDAVVTVTGIEYGERNVIDVPAQRVNRQEILERAASALAAIQGHVDSLDAEMAAWSGYNSAQVSASLRTVVLPALRYSLLVEKHLARLVTDTLDAVD